MDTHKRVFLEYYRGVAAFGVAVAHYFADDGGAFAEFVSTIFVEMFFPLSGFVLAPQVLKIYSEPRHCKVFLYRRWLRTLPVYFVGLAAMAVLTHQSGGWNFLKYAAFLNFLTPHYAENNYYAVAWSLAVEEYYYVFFPLFLFIFRGGLLRKTLLFVAFSLLIKIVCLHFFEPRFVRIATYARLDAIALGFAAWLLYHDHKQKILDIYAMAMLALFIAFVGLGIWFFVTRTSVAMLCFLYSSTLLFSGACIGLLRHEQEKPLTKFFAKKLGLFAGKISYSTYVFHPLALVLAAQFHLSAFTYLFIVLLIATVMYQCLEAPILAQRPNYSELVLDQKTA